MSEIVSKKISIKTRKFIDIFVLQKVSKINFEIQLQKIENQENR